MFVFSRYTRNDLWRIHYYPLYKYFRQTRRYMEQLLTLCCFSTQALDPNYVYIVKDRSFSVLGHFVIRPFVDPVPYKADRGGFTQNEKDMFSLLQKNKATCLEQKQMPQQEVQLGSHPLPQETKREKQRRKQKRRKETKNDIKDRR